MNGSRDDAGPPPSNNRNEDEDFNSHNEPEQQRTSFRPRDHMQQHPRTKPDYGEVLLSKDIRHAPKSLDHFKRGYQERVVQRDKEFYSRRHGSDGRGAGDGGRSTANGGERGKGRAGGNNMNNDMDRSGGRRSGFTSRFTEPNDPWSQNYRDRPTILQGLDINALCDRLTPKLNSKEALFAELDRTRQQNEFVFESGKAMTALISVAARRKNIGLGHAVWDWMDYAGLTKNTFHYNSMISVTEKARNYQRALDLLQEMTDRSVPKNEVTFSSAISACEKSGQWKIALDLLNAMESENVGRTAIAYNAAISACEKGLVPQKACEVFQRMRREGIAPSVVSFSALISAAEKGGQWRLALEILEEMKREGFRGNVVAYSAAISALAKGQQWQRALQLFREIQSHGGQPSIVTYNATMTALEKGMQWEKALDLFEEMKMRNLPITVVSYGSAISACDKGFQYRQCLEFLDEMTEMGIQKNVIIFGAAMSCMEKCSRADIGFQLMKRMKEDGIQPNVHIFNSAISACARSNLWEKGYELYLEMERVGVKRDVVTYNAVLDAVCSQIRLGRDLFIVGVERGFYAKVSRLGESWFELDLHFLSLGGGEIALGWWFEECLVPYLQNTDKLESVKSISIVTGYGKTRTRGRRHGDDGMRKRCKAMLSFMNIKEHDQSNLGRIHVDKESLIEEVTKNGGKIVFDLDGYLHWKETETTANVIPDTAQKIRARFAPVVPGSGRPPFTRIESDNTSEEYRLEYQKIHGRSIDKADGEYRSDVDYAVRDGTRFAKGNDRSPSGTPARGSLRGINEEATNSDRHGEGSGGGGGGRKVGSWDGGTGGGNGLGEPQRIDRMQDQPSSAMSQRRVGGLDGSRDDGQKFDGPSSFIESGRRFDQESRNADFSRNGDSRVRDRWGTQAHDLSGGSGDGYGDSYHQSGHGNYGGGNNRNGQDLSRYRGDHPSNGRHPEERFGGEPRHVNNARSQELGGSRDHNLMPPNQNRVDGRNGGPSQAESVGGGWREQAQRPTQYANQDDRYHHNDQHHRDNDRKRPFNEDSDRASGDLRHHESDVAERRSSTGSRGYTLDPPPIQRRRQS